METNGIAMKFVGWDVPELESLKDSFPYRMKVKLMAGEKLTREEKNRLYAEFVRGGYCVHLQGWSFSFGEFVQRYWVKYAYRHIEQVWSLDKSAIRANEGGIVEIVGIA